MVTNIIPELSGDTDRTTTSTDSLLLPHGPFLCHPACAAPQSSTCLPLTACEEQGVCHREHKGTFLSLSADNEWRATTPMKQPNSQGKQG